VFFMRLIQLSITGALIVLSGCSPAPPASVQPPTAPPAPPATGVAPTTAPAIIPAFRIAATNPPTLDPGLAADAVSVDLITQLFEGLVRFDESGAVAGVHAERWDISTDGLTYTFTLRPGLTWSDGRPITAQDYVWAWRRNVDPDTASDYATMLYPIKNATKISKESLSPDQLGVVATNDRTLVVTLEEPAAYFLRLASTWTLYPLREDVIDRHGDKWTDADKIVTNGPYLMKEWRQDAQVTLERNESYWGTKPSLQRAVYRIFPESGANQALAAYEANEIDTLGTQSFQIPAAELQRLQNHPSLQAEIREYAESGTMFIPVNTRQPHLKDPRVRMALGAALDRNQILTQVLRRGGKPALTLQTEGIVGRNPEAWTKEDVGRAKQLLADAGYPNGSGFPDLIYTYNSNDQQRLLAEHLQQRWKDTLGITVKLESMEFATLLKWRHENEWVRTGGLYAASWFSDYEDPNNWFNALWDSHDELDMFNTGWSDSEFDRIARLARGELDAQKREQLYRQAEERLAQAYPAIPVYHAGGRTLLKPHVGGFAPTRLLGIIPLRSIQMR
jgi:oligopeptide transport system substrate-binding protein